jgi:2-polyprenyl-3-methyl-5-hydroxy-6-metoxy-1,4-benzoquinol methylase
MSWSGSDLSNWWRHEIESDPAYEEVVTPLLIQILQPRTGASYLDLGCGEGRVMRSLAALGSIVHGVDVNEDMAKAAGSAAVAMIPDLPVRADSHDGVYSVLTLEHIEDEDAFFEEAARVTRPGGVLALVINHPVWTAPGSTPILDEDGETLWRPGDYFSPGESEMPAGEWSVTFHHRSLSALLNSAASAGWCLAHMVEQPHHEFEDQVGIPRLLACRWTLMAQMHD